MSPKSQAETEKEPITQEIDQSELEALIAQAVENVEKQPDTTANNAWASQMVQQQSDRHFRQLFAKRYLRHRVRAWLENQRRRDSCA